MRLSISEYFLCVLHILQDIYLKGTAVHAGLAAYAAAAVNLERLIMLAYGFGHLPLRLGQVEEAFESDTRRMKDDKLAAAADAIKLMNTGIDKENEQTLAAARDAFAAVDATAFAATITALNNAITVLAKQ